jgi:hypothetical protein
MKKILLATTAMLLSAGVAQAQALRITGEGRMGILYERVSVGDGFVSFSNSDWQQENRLQLNFTVGVTADHGLSFGAFSRVRINNGSSGVFSGSRVWVEANNLRLTFGNVDGAIRGAGTSHGYAGGCYIGYVGGHYCADTAGLVGGVSHLGFAGTLFTNAAGTATSAVIQPGQTQGFNSTAGGPAARIRLDYTFGDTRVALSSDRGGSTEIGVRSRFDAITVAMGYANRASFAEWVDTGGTFVPGAFLPVGIRGREVAGSVLTASAHYNGGSWGVGVIVARVSYSASGLFQPFGSLSHTNWAISGNVEVGGGNLTAYAGRQHAAWGLNAAMPGDPAFYVGLFRVPVNAFGVSYGYGLGGGATLTAGIETISGSFAGVSARATSASVGVAFTF